ncbi:8933_t:CDS:2 [Diversispora eburnea]|uniref:8933_t:CDS:1 n=1 Tax=Diversispora eburnea TaxID=1213867 RepID=A0A9N9GWI9_9GLOM|nr:8933_t:CDS:2 [Diversispora eburnea]
MDLKSFRKVVKRVLGDAVGLLKDRISADNPHPVRKLGSKKIQLLANYKGVCTYQLVKMTYIVYQLSRYQDSKVFNE